MQVVLEAFENNLISFNSYCIENIEQFLKESFTVV